LDPASLKHVLPYTQRMLIKLNNGCYYYGLVKNSQATDPQGIFIFHDGTYYSGEMREGNFEGRGKLTQASVDFKEVIFQYEG